ncbi:hypothetical protein ETAA8_34310 [Anatilimnocola aggregata]|uniref:Uncharacterized protein n=1 Tax=Anatilimnocola aggregata TaxID=2528021 RepID=A0A517YDM2_9BACT|nr:hypothetical protein [Anatilimnocola aggregata]QDU28331.1 hypothetical protein ETAA8_34310 [Anatilimnocola aggregata]
MKSLLRPSFALLVAVVGLCGSATESQAEWPRYRVSASYSLPSAPAYRPVLPGVQMQPVAQAYHPVSPPPPAFYGSPVAPSYYAPQPVAGSTTSFHPLTSQYTPYSYAQQPFPPYQAPVPPRYNPQINTAYYGPQPHQTPLTLPTTPQSVHTYGNYYQPERPAASYSPNPGFHYLQPAQGQY